MTRLRSLSASTPATGNSFSDSAVTTRVSNSPNFLVGDLPDISNPRPKKDGEIGRSNSVRLGKVPTAQSSGTSGPKLRNVKDTNGWVPDKRYLETLGIGKSQFDAFRECKALLGMTSEAQYQEFKETMLKALEEDGITSDMVDIRAHGSSANFYSSERKPFDIAKIKATEHGEEKLNALLGDSTAHPACNTFDSRHYFGLDEKSDYDLNFSSTEMVRRARIAWDTPEVKEARAHWEAAELKKAEEKWAKEKGGELPETEKPKMAFFATRSHDWKEMGHAYLSKPPVMHAFPNLIKWAAEWEKKLGREISYGVFQSVGSRPYYPTPGTTVHHQESDWVVHKPENGNLATGRAAALNVNNALLSRAPGEREETTRQDAAPAA